MIISDSSWLFWICKCTEGNKENEDAKSPSSPSFASVKIMYPSIPNQDEAEVAFKKTKKAVYAPVPVSVNNSESQPITANNSE
jgi:hypothetical protein